MGRQQIGGFFRQISRLIPKPRRIAPFRSVTVSSSFTDFRGYPDYLLSEPVGSNIKNGVAKYLRCLEMKAQAPFQSRKLSQQEV